MKHFSRTAIAAFILAAPFGVAPALADMTTYKAMLTGSEEVPATTTKGTGTVDVTYDSATKKLSWKGSYSGLTGPATAAHFHGPADAGKNAGVEVPVTPATSPLEGSATITETQASDLMAGKLYLNVHTAAHPNGEIRGQVMMSK